jgi:hypothetical protein
MLNRRDRAELRDRAIQRVHRCSRFLRDWLSLAGLIDWCAAATTTAGIAEQQTAQDLALKLFGASIRNGEFDRPMQPRNKPGILWLIWLAPAVPGDSAPPRSWLSRESFDFDVFPNSFPHGLLPEYWMPRDLARRWLRSHGYPEFPDASPNVPAAAGDTAEARGTRSDNDSLAEWIFARLAHRKSFEALFAEAGKTRELGEFRKGDFLAAYRKVYATKAHRPPATGWPLRSPYGERPTAGKARKVAE